MSKKLSPSEIKLASEEFAKDVLDIEKNVLKQVKAPIDSDVIAVIKLRFEEVVEKYED